MAAGKLKTLLWGATSPNKAEKKLLFKIDWFILSFCCLAYVRWQPMPHLSENFHRQESGLSSDTTRYFSNYLDRANLNNAYLSGMKEDLHMHGNQITKVNTIFTCGYIIGMIPNNVALLKFSPRIWFPGTILAWGLFTLGTYRVSSVTQLYVIRFFQGFFEASSFTGTHYILGSWYSESELTKRSGIFTASGLAGTLFSGFLQSAIYKNMNGVRGLAGWRWLFIFDFIITAPIAIYGFLFFPNTPETTGVFYLTPKEKILAVERLPAKPKTQLSWDIFTRVLGRWHFWMFSSLWAITGEVESFSSNNLLGLYLQAMDRSVAVRDDYPMGVSAVGIVATIITAFYVDFTGKHWHVGIWTAAVGIISSILILVYRPEPLVYVGYYLAGMVYATQAAFFAWANVVCRADNEERAIVLASMNLFSNAVNAWWSIVFYSANFAPRFQRGMWAMIGVSITLFVWVLVIRWFQSREQKKSYEREEVEVVEKGI